MVKGINLKVKAFYDQDTDIRSILHAACAITEKKHKFHITQAEATTVAIVFPLLLWQQLHQAQAG